MIKYNFDELLLLSILYLDKTKHTLNVIYTL